MMHQSLIGSGRTPLEEVNGGVSVVTQITLSVVDYLTAFLWI